MRSKSYVCVQITPSVWLPSRDKGRNLSALFGRGLALRRAPGRLAIRNGLRRGKDLVNALEEPLDLAGVAVRHAVLQDGEDLLRILGRAPLHALPLGRQEDAARTAVTGMGLAANQTPLLQEPEDGRHRVRVRVDSFHDGDLRDTWLACHNGE